MRDVKVLDCTFRDGGYYNAWDYSPELINAYLKVMSTLPVDVVEIGFRLIPGSSGKFYGGCAYSTDDYIRAINVPNGLKIAVMVNGADLLQYPPGVEDAVSRLFQPVTNSPVELVRIACHVNKLEESLPAINRLKELGYKTTVNLMQIAGLATTEIERLAQLASTYPIDILYFADSLGSMEQDDVNNTVDALRRHWKGELGFHAHNNMEMALSNSIRAFEVGVTWIDATVLGMGRGPGNTRTEYLALELESRLGYQVNITPLLELINKYFKPMQLQYGWGPNPFYYMAGKCGIHPTFVQEMLSDSRYNEEDVLTVIENLKKTGGKSYQADALEGARNFYSDNAKGNWDSRNLMQGKDVLILGSGPGAVKHKEAIKNYIKQTNPVVIALNKQSPIEHNMIDARAACHPVRILADYDDHMNLPQPLIVPYSMLPAHIKELFKGKTIYDYGMTVKEGVFEYQPSVGVLPNSLVVAYALAIVNSGGAKRVLLSGFDGYGLEDPRTHELNEMFDIYFSNKESIPLIAVTPTQHAIQQISIYDPILLGDIL